MLKNFSPTASLAMMCLDRRGELLFATARARDLFQRWNDSLGNGNDREYGLHLPNDIGGLFAATRRRVPSAQVSPPKMPARWMLHHPNAPGLALRVGVGEISSERGRQACYMLHFEEHATADRLACLTPRERRVALLAAEGLSNEDIARHLCRSRRTVEFQLCSIYRKLDVTCRVHLVRVLS